MLDLEAILTAATTGAVTGYLTNNLALKMIFKEYGPLGGVVIKTKNEFIESISKLVEKDLINHQTLEEEFSRPEFKRNFTNSISDFLNIYLADRVEKIKVKDINGWKTNYQKSSSFLSKQTIQLLEKNSSRLSSELQLQDLISEKEIKELTADFYQQFLISMSQKKAADKVILTFYEELKQKEISRLISPELRKKITNFIKEAVFTFRDNYQAADSAKKDQIKNKLADLFDFKNLIKELLAELKELKVENLFKNENELEKIINNNQLKKNLKEVLINLKIEINNSNIKLADFINEDLENKSKSELQKIIYAAEPELIGFLDQNEEEVNKIIFEAVEAEIENSSGLKAVSRNGIYSKYKENIEEYGLPLAHLKNYLTEKIHNDNNMITDNILTKSKELEISNFIDNIELEKLAAKLQNNFFEFYQENKREKLINLSSAELFTAEKMEEKIFSIIFKLLKSFSQDEESLAVIGDYLFSLKLEDLLKKDKLKENLAQLSQKIYKAAENEAVVKKLSDYLNQNLFKLINNEISKNREKYEAVIKKEILNYQPQAAEIKLSKFYNYIQNEEDSAVKLCEILSDFFNKNLPEIIEGRVAQAASANLHQLSDQEVQTAIEDFMGKELKPITYLGALLGAAAGIIFSLSGAESAIFTASPIWIDYLSSAFLYGAVGWLTNVLAIWMIFHPYQKIEFAGLKLPFTPGVVAKNRNRFADSMGKFVEKELLNADSAAELIEANRNQIKNKTLQYFIDNDYQLLFEVLKNNKEVFAEKAAEILLVLGEELDGKKIKKIISNSNLEINDLIKNKFTQIDYQQTAVKYLENNDLLKNLSTSLAAGLDISEITESVSGKYSFNLSSIQVKNLLKDKKLYPLLKHLLPQLLEKDYTFNLKEYLLENIKADKNKYLDQVLAQFYQQESRIADLINFKKDEIIEKEKEKKGGLLKNTLISGAIYMADLDEFIEAVTARVFSRLKEDFLFENKNKLEENFAKLIEKIEKIELKELENLKINQLLTEFFASDSGDKLLTEVIYLSDDQIKEIIEDIIKAEEKELFALNINLRAEEIKYFIEKELSLEQKLKMLLSLKNIFAVENVEAEFLRILKNFELKEVNSKIIKLLQDKKLLNAEKINSELVEKAKNRLIEILANDYQTDIEKELTAFILELTDFLENEFEGNTLKYLLTIFIESGIESLKNNSEALLESLELEELTAAEVRKMNPAEIEAVFDSFAGKYFSHLKQYGWFGGVFGVLQLIIRTIM